MQRICKESIQSYRINFNDICLENFEYFHGAPTCAKCHLLHSFMCSCPANKLRPVEHHNKRSQLSQATVRPVGWYWQTAGTSHCPAPVNRTDCFIKLTRGSSAACRGSKSTRGSISESCFSSVFLNVITCRPNAHLNQALVNWYCCMEFAETHEPRHKESCL